MSEEHRMPGSIGARASDPGAETNLTDPTLVRLYESLKGLDRAVHETLRALDVALGRAPTSGPPQALPFREMGRLRQEIEAAAGSRRETPRRSLGEIALEHADDDEPEPRAGTGVAGVVPDKG